MLFMDTYIEKYVQYKKKIIFDFKLGDGGIGDCIKYFMFTLTWCVRFNYKLYYLVNNTTIEKLLLLKYKKMYIQKEDISDSRNINRHENVIGVIENINEDINYIVFPGTFYDVINYDIININIQDVFQFSDNVIDNSIRLLPANITDYISIHLRLGDKYLETDKSYIACLEDERKYNENKIFEFIEKHSTENILFFCDNNSCKLTLKSIYNNIIITNSDIGHTGLINTTENQVLDTVTEFYILTNSKLICAASPSGFSMVASKFKNTPIVHI